MSSSKHTILNEYKSAYCLYNEFCSVMQDHLLIMLKRGRYKYHIKNRIKDIVSLSEKIERKKNVGKHYEHIEDVQDIAGIRVVFYTELDKKRFLKRLKKEFGDAMEIQEVKGPHGYASTHVISSLSHEKLELPEYKKFSGLKCEIQLTLILDHAWAEVEHDLLYKAELTEEYIDRDTYENLKARMEKIMSGYIKRASMELESIIAEIKKLKDGKK